MERGFFAHIEVERRKKKTKTRSHNSGIIVHMLCVLCQKKEKRKRGGERGEKEGGGRGTVSC